MIKLTRDEEVLKQIHGYDLKKTLSLHSIENPNIEIFTIGPKVAK